MTVLELLDELEEIIDTAPKLPLTGKIMVDANEILDLAKDIRLSLPDDVQQAKWVQEEKDRILSDAKKEYEKIIIEAKKQADTMVEKDIITERAVDVSGEIYRRADEYSKQMSLRTYTYMDDVICSFRDKIDEVNTKYVAAMYENLNSYFNEMTEKIDHDLDELRRMTEEAKNSEIPQHDIEIPLGAGRDKSQEDN